MKTHNKKRHLKGFTLIEIIVVLIILGVLASLAVSAYMDWVEKSKASEAVFILKNMADNIEGCMAVEPSNSAKVTACVNALTAAQISPNFIIAKAGPSEFPAGSGQYSYLLVALKNTNQGSSTFTSFCDGSGVVYTSSVGQSMITLCHRLNGRREIVGFGKYQGIF